MATESVSNWQSILDLVAELKRCDEAGLVTASVAMAYICIDTLASLGRPVDKPKVTRSDFKDWVDSHLKAHSDQHYQYRGKDVYAARCAFLHKYGSEAELHQSDPDTIKFAYHDGDKHQYNPSVEHGLVLIGTRSFVTDVVHAVDSFLHQCNNDALLRQRVESRPVSVMQTIPYPL
ncbi:hypothetical protein MARLIPOL_06179 [Marinobacter lipolyticus SM19]|uniref:Uncharacterized protein n=1 Tax=Marinobacter lipolyticus SM19 TaxID=1318628 RepID=R8B2V0_9GAMM|nr:hypothetical protein [Marinobacter lipolyticus]EON92928.1 hypothetical protein MARLIPOL_06179 [Marinobacter lipolyticus SM19]